MKTLQVRLTAGLAAQSCSVAVTIGMQLVSVPILITAWGVEAYGVWLLITAISAYLVLADLGFAQVGASDMTMRVSAGDRTGAQATFHTVAAMNAILGLVASALMAVMVCSPILGMLIGEQHATADVRLAVAVLAFHMLLALFQGVVGAGLRAEGQFALMSLIYAVLRLFDALAVILTAVSGGSLLAGAAAMLGARAIATTLIVVVVARRWPWLAPSVAGANAADARRMLGPSLHYTGYALGNLVNIYGMTIVVGAILGPTAAAVASTARTLARTGALASVLLNNALQPEYSRQFGQRRPDAARRLFAWHIGAVAIAAVFYLAAMLSLGPWFYDLWTKDAVALPAMLLPLLAFAAAGEMIWTAMQTPAVAANRMRLTGAGFVLASIAGLAVLAVAGRQEGIVLFGWVAVGISVMMVAAALLEMRRLKAGTTPIG